MLEPQATIDQPQLKRGLGVLTVEVVFSAILARARGRFGRPPAVAGAAPPEELSDALAEGAEDAGEAGRP